MDIFADPKSPEMLDQSLQGFLSNGDTTVLSYAAVSLIDSFLLQVDRIKTANKIAISKSRRIIV